MLARCLTSSPRVLVAYRPGGLVARRAVAGAAGAGAAGEGPSSSDGGSPSLPANARTSEASAISLRTVRQRDQVAALQSKLAGDAPPRTSAVLLAPDEAGWRELDEKVNEYPESRVFKGIGTTAGDDRALFEAAMVRAIESVVGVKVAPGAVVTRDSSGGKYVSVSVEVTVHSGEEVAAVFTAIKKEAGAKLKWLM